MSEMRIALMQEIAVELREAAPALTEHEIALIAWDRAGLGSLTWTERAHLPQQRDARHAETVVGPLAASRRG